MAVKISLLGSWNQPNVVRILLTYLSPLFFWWLSYNATHKACVKDFASQDLKTNVSQ